MAANLPRRAIVRVLCGHKGLRFLKVTVNQSIQFVHKFRILLSQIGCFADVLLQVVKFKPVGLVVVVTKEADEFPIAFANPNAGTVPVAGI